MNYFIQVLCLLLCTTLYAQDDSTEVEEPVKEPVAAQGNSRVISYSFKPSETNFESFDKSFPFDLPFTIRFTDIPDDITFISIELHRLRVNQKHKADVINIVPEPWKRPLAGGDVTSGDVLIDTPLPPNAIYTTLIKYGYEAKLSDDEMDALYGNISKDAGVHTTYNKMVNSLAKGTTKESSTVITTKIKKVLESIFSVIEKKQPDYILPDISKEDYSQILNKVRAFRDPAKNINNRLEEMTKDSSINGEVLQKVAEVKIAIGRVNWGSIKDFETGEIRTLLDEIDTEGSKKIIKLLGDAIQARDKIPDIIINDIVVSRTFKKSLLGQTYLENFVENAKLYITLDLGYAHVFRADRWMAYSGVNIYFRPVNKNLPLSFYRSCKDWFGVRTSLLVGISMNSIEKDKVRKGLIDDKALVLGAGLRLTPFLKLNTGAFIHYRYETNPLLSRDRYHTSLSPFVSLSIDLDAKALFTGVGEAMFK